MGNYNFITDLELRPEPHTKFVDTLLWIFKKDLEEAYAAQDYLLLTHVFQRILYQTFTTNLPVTDDDKAIFDTINRLYQDNLQELRNIKKPDPLLCSALATHQYFLEKLKQHQIHQDWLTKFKLSLCNDIQTAILKRRMSELSYQNETIARKCYCINCRQADFKSKMNLIIERHSNECQKQNTQEGKFGLLAQMVRDDQLQSENLPNLHELITHTNVPGIQAYFITERNKLRAYNIFQKRWLNQLSQPKVDPVAYYQGWTRHNPYQHAKSMALRQTAIYTATVVIVAVIISLGIAACTVGVGNLVFAHVCSVPGAYGLGMGTMGTVTAGVTYAYNRKQYAFKQQAIQTCIPLVDELVANTLPSKIKGL